MAFPQPEEPVRHRAQGTSIFGCSTVTFLPHTVGKIGSVSSSTTRDSFKANVAWEEFCVLQFEVAGSV